MPDRSSKRPRATRQPAKSVARAAPGKMTAHHDGIDDDVKAPAVAGKARRAATTKKRRAKIAKKATKSK